MRNIFFAFLTLIISTQQVLALGGQGNAVIIGSVADGDCIKSGGGVLLKDAGFSCSGGMSTPFLKLDQSTPQTVINGSPVFNAGISVGEFTNFSTDGFVKFTSGNGTLAVDTNTYLTGNQTITVSGDVAGSGATSIVTTINPNVVSNAKIRQSAGLSVVGNSTNATANVADITGTANQVLRVSGTTLGFGSVNLASTSAVTGVLPYGNGGTGQSAYLTGGLVVSNAAVFTSSISATWGVSGSGADGINVSPAKKNGVALVVTSGGTATLAAEFQNDAGTNETTIDKTDGSINTNGNIKMNIAGEGIYVKEGTNARMGLATLVGGTVTVANTGVTANTRIFYSIQTLGGTQGFLRTTRTAGTSFTITSSSSLETSTVAWILFEPS